MAGSTTKETKYIKKENNKERWRENTYAVPLSHACRLYALFLPPLLVETLLFRDDFLVHSLH
jgi:hypothetical protein